MSLRKCAAIVGIDWADEKHAVCLIDAKNEIRQLDSLDQEPEAIAKWVGGLERRFPEQKILVCLEQKRGALIYALMKFDCLILVPINPKQLARFREVLGSSGAKDDPTDAQMLAELAFKHMDHVRPWDPDDEQTRRIRLLAEDRRKLVDDRTALTNRLKSQLKQYFPVALDVTGDCIYSNLACQLLQKYPTLESLQSASDKELEQFYRQHKCYRDDLIAKRLQEIRDATALTTDQAIIDSSIHMVRAVVAQIIVLNEAIATYDVKLASLMRNHRDAEIFESFPGAGKAMAPRLLAATGSDRDRYEDAQEVQQMSGIAPVTRRSGRSKVVRRRWACNRFLLQTYHEYAAHSLQHSVWAKAYYDMKRHKGYSHQTAVRALAFKWIRIIVRCWKSRTKYNELIYTSSLLKRNSPILKFVPSSAT